MADDTRELLETLHGWTNTLITGYGSVGQGEACAPEVHERMLALLEGDRARFEDALGAVVDAGVFDADRAAGFRTEVNRTCQWVQADTYARATGARSRPARPDSDWRAYLRQPAH